MSSGVKRAGVAPLAQAVPQFDGEPETELMREYDSQPVCKVDRSTMPCADLDVDFQRATGRAKTGAAQKPAQDMSVMAGMSTDTANVTIKNRPGLPSDSGQSPYLRNNQVGDTGLEPVTSRV